MLRRAVVPIIVAIALNAREARALVVDLPRTGAPCVATPALACGSAQALLTGAFLLPATQGDEGPGAALALADGALAAGDFNMLARLARPIAAFNLAEAQVALANTGGALPRTRIPEPSTVVLTGTGLLAVLAMVRRRRATGRPVR